MPVTMPDALERIAAKHRITEEDVLTVRRLVYPDGHIGPEEAEWLFRLNEASHDQTRAWHDLFVEALTDYVVNQAEPSGYVSEANAHWLITRIDHDGKVETASELELLVNVLDKARSSPVGLVRYALEQVKQGVLTGKGPTRSGVELEPGRIGAAEVELLRRILYAYGGDGRIAISRAEAEMLFDINDAVGEADNHPSWSDLFVKAVANSLMAASGYEVPTRQEALRLEAWRDDDTVSAVDFFGRALAGGLRSILASYSRDVAWDERLKARSRDIVESERVSEAEAHWLAERITRSGHLHDNERQLLAFIARESPDVHPVLRPLLDEVA